MTRSPLVGALAALALVTAALEAAAVALDPRDLTGTLVLAAGIWFQGAWAVFVWLRPRPDVFLAGLIANAALFAMCLLRVADLAGRPPFAAEVLVLGFQAALIVGLAAVLLADPLIAPRMGRLLPSAVAGVAVLLAGASLAMAGPGIAPPGVVSPIVGTASRASADASVTKGGSVATANPPVALAVNGSPSEPGLSVGASAPGVVGPAMDSPPTPTPATAFAQSTPTATATEAGVPATKPPPPTPGPTVAPSAAGATPPGRATARPARVTRVPSGTAATTASVTSAATATSTPKPPTSTIDTPTLRPTATPTPRATPRPTPSLTPQPTPQPPPSPTPRPTPEPTPAQTTTPGVPGTITFGSNYDHDTLAIIGPTSTIHAHELIAWRADLSQPAGSTTLTFTITQPNPNGIEAPHWQQDFSVPDSSYVVIVNRVDLSEYVHGNPGTFVMRIRRGPDGPILAEGEFRLVP